MPQPDGANAGENQKPSRGGLGLVLNDNLSDGEDNNNFEGFKSQEDY